MSVKASKIRDHRQFWLGVFILLYLVAFVVTIFVYGMDAAFQVMALGTLLEAIWVFYLGLSRSKKE